MTLVPLINATMPIPLHALAAILALVIGAAQLWLAKGTARHRQLGYVWVGLMAFVAISGFFIYETRLFGVFSLIHLLSVLVLVTLWRAVRMARWQNQGAPTGDDPAVLAGAGFDRIVHLRAGADHASGCDGFLRTGC